MALILLDGCWGHHSITVVNLYHHKGQLVSIRKFGSDKDEWPTSYNLISQTANKIWSTLATFEADIDQVQAAAVSVWHHAKRPSPWMGKIMCNYVCTVGIHARCSVHVKGCDMPDVMLADKLSPDVCECVWGLSLALRNIGPRCYFITDWQLWQKPWHRNRSSKGSVDSSGVIRINAQTSE